MPKKKVKAKASMKITNKFKSSRTNSIIRRPRREKMAMRMSTKFGRRVF